jgi:hypothetical protein
MTAQTLARTAPPTPTPDVDTAAALLIREIELYLAARRRTGHPLITATTEELIRLVLVNVDTALRDDSGRAAPGLPGGLWRVPPDRLLSPHPARRSEGVERLRISAAEHLELTALVLERWGWAQTGGRVRTAGGRRCILGAQAVVYRLGYGTDDTAATAGAHLDAVLRTRGITTPYPAWNEQPDVDRAQVLALVRDAAAEASR